MSDTAFGLLSEVPVIIPKATTSATGEVDRGKKEGGPPRVSGANGPWWLSLCGVWREERAFQSPKLGSRLKNRDLAVGVWLPQSGGGAAEKENQATSASPLFIQLQAAAFIRRCFPRLLKARFRLIPVGDHKPCDIAPLLETLFVHVWRLHSPIDSRKY